MISVKIDTDSLIKSILGAKNNPPKEDYDKNPQDSGFQGLVPPSDYNAGNQNNQGLPSNPLDKILEEENYDPNTVTGRALMENLEGSKKFAESEWNKILELLK